MTTPVAEQVLTRAKLSAPYRINVAYGGPLTGTYAHARAADPHGSILDKAADAQAEIDRIGAMYATLRRFITVTVRKAAYRPGQVVSITYPRYGLDAGAKAFVASVTPDIGGTTCKLTLWL